VWHYLDRQMNADLRTVVISPKDGFDESMDGFPHLRLSPDGTLLLRLTMSNGASWLRSYDTTTGQEQFAVRHGSRVAEPARPAKKVHHLAFTPDSHGIRLVIQTDGGFETRQLGGSPRPESRKP
jgi:hypothetical protein